MTEPRMRQRVKGQQFAPNDLEALLMGFGDSPQPPLKETIRTLDEIITDFIIETSHAAALCASYSRRAKIKVDDFKFMLRRDPKKLGRVLEMLSMDKRLKAERKAFSMEEEELKRAKAAQRAEERSKKRKGGARDDEDEEEDEDGADGSIVNGTTEKKKPRKKRVKKEKERE
ncbi:TFIID-18kDa-domain-containing protein [Rhizodiscina lignyota]|uniref:Transcription initiation factor TFIID subunit 13 n=1 Tax=Rhizodiscina lignyota TaxID=1504668 RepID=A0A9P4IFU0_9PEZI|nr:TFIID-18kDa-domain-containing protein [Rhizodiscina lignyota]